MIARMYHTNTKLTTIIHSVQYKQGCRIIQWHPIFFGSMSVILYNGMMPI